MAKNRVVVNASIVTYNTSKEELFRVISCLITSSISNIYIIDNSPIDLLEELCYTSPKLEYIHGHGNIGYGAAHNIAIQKAIEIGATYHIIINPDIYFEIGAIETMIDYMAENLDVGHLMPKVIYPDGSLQYLCKLLPTPYDLIGRRFFNRFSFFEKSNHHFELRKTGYDKVMNVPFLSGCFMFLRVDALKKVGLFDDKIFMYGEDIDLSRRIHRYYKSIYYPFVTIVHAHKKESFTSRKMLIIHIKSIIYYFNKWGWFFDSERKKMNRQCLTAIGL